jgi:hypothetical protein
MMILKWCKRRGPTAAISIWGKKDWGKNEKPEESGMFDQGN